MAGQGRTISVALLLLTGVSVLASCSSEGPTGPELGDLLFSPGNVQLVGDQRNAVVALRNVSQESLGPTVVGIDTNVTMVGDPDELCDGIQAQVVGSPAPVLAPGTESNVDITIDMSGVNAIDCPPGRYSAPFIAAVGSKILAANLFIEFDWAGTPP